MAASRVESRFVNARTLCLAKTTRSSQYTCVFCQHVVPSRLFPISSRLYSGGARRSQGPFRTRLCTALQRTKIEWRPIPITLGIGFLGAIQFYRVRKREQARQEAEEEEEEEKQQSHRPAKRKRIKPSGPWSEQLCCLPWRKSFFLSSTNLSVFRQVQVMSTLPLKAVSRLWGRFNELEIPYYLRVPGFKLYSWIFGVK